MLLLLWIIIIMIILSSASLRCVMTHLVWNAQPFKVFSTCPIYIYIYTLYRVQLWADVNRHLQFAKTLRSNSRNHLVHYSGIALLEQKSTFLTVISKAVWEAGPIKHHLFQQSTITPHALWEREYDAVQWRAKKTSGENEWENGEDVFRAKSRMMYLAGLRLQEWMRSSWMGRACSRCWMSALLIPSRCCLSPLLVLSFLPPRSGADSLSHAAVS